VKPETLIYEKIQNIIPDKSEKTVFFVGMDKSSYEVFFYTFIDGKSYQCFELAEQGVLDENKLDTVFAEIVNIVKKSKIYNSDKKNIATIILDKIRIKLNMDYEEMDARWYRIKKEWEKKNIEKSEE
jgi:hypothetical protein